MTDSAPPRGLPSRAQCPVCLHEQSIAFPVAFSDPPLPQHLHSGYECLRCGTEWVEMHRTVITRERPAR